MLDLLINIEFGGKVYTESTWLNDFVTVQRKLIDYYSSDEAISNLSDKIKGTIERNLYAGNTYTGDAVAPLAPFTVKLKGHAKPFFETGELYRSIAKRKIAKGYELYVLPGRVAIAALLNYGDPDKNLPARPFWGLIPERADVLISQMLNDMDNTYRRAA